MTPAERLEAMRERARKVFDGIPSIFSPARVRHQGGGWEVTALLNYLYRTWKIRKLKRQGAGAK